MPGRYTYRARQGTLKLRALGLSKDVGFRTDKLMKDLENLLMLYERTGDDAVEIINEIAEDTFNRIVADTPVDTGRAAGGWDMTNLTRPGVVEFVYKNDVPYIVYLEFGSSQQAPKGMLRINLQKARERVRARIARLLVSRFGT